MVEHLPSMSKALNSNSRTKKGEGDWGATEGILLLCSPTKQKATGCLPPRHLTGKGSCAEVPGLSQSTKLSASELKSSPEMDTSSCPGLQ